MKTIEEFSAFKLNKNQMGAVKGDVKCQVDFDGYIETFEGDLSKEQAMQYLMNTYGWMEGVEIIGCE